MGFCLLRPRTFVFVSLLSGLFAASTRCASAQTSFGTVTLGGGKSLAVTLTIPVVGSFSTISVVTQGAPNLDYTNAGGGTCTAARNYLAGATCTVEVEFSPRHPGVRYGAVVLANASGVVTTAYLEGKGTGTLTQNLPGSVLPAASALNGPFAIAVDGAQNIYVADGGTVEKESYANGTYTQTTLGSGWINANGIAVDGAGNVYVSDGWDYIQSYPGNAGQEAIYKLTPVGGTYMQTVVASGFGQLTDVAVDGAGNLYATDMGYIVNGYPVAYLLKETPSASGYNQTIVDNFSQPTAAAVDAGGNVYVMDAGLGGVYVETYAGGAYTQQALPIAPAGLALDTGLAIDGEGNLYVAAQVAGDSYPAILYRETPANGTYIQTEAGSGWPQPSGLAVDSNGDISSPTLSPPPYPRSTPEQRRRLRRC